ncbi:hypothetical protein PT285_01855 [Lactobacillus sp. ESL0791]|uniref:matrixin family metalloprotease n=1 Tax=Lactobacillus sp. ESL0791 TaxID=2983234 RepID=UPI0023F6F940|nr:matrixin family metalloprotease [Lactobacillus sp. ESL0791]MDF7638182.1 hypothetical protein [Lactobacillus sp. ESL0791]
MNKIKTIKKLTAVSVALMAAGTLVPALNINSNVTAASKKDKNINIPSGVRVPWKIVHRTKNIPKIKKFTLKRLKQYHLTGKRWKSPTITYNDSALSATQQNLTAETAEQINQLKIVHLKQTTKKAKITIKIDEADINHPTDVGNTSFDIGTDIHKGLYNYTHAKITMHDKIIYHQLQSADAQNGESSPTYQLYFKHFMAHELGHVLGLTHTGNLTTSTMTSNLVNNASGTTLLTPDFIQSLAVLYEN